MTFKLVYLKANQSKIKYMDKNMGELARDVPTLSLLARFYFPMSSITLNGRTTDN